ncbi:MAG TPA: phosphopantetheine-binding protein [Pseudonocardiaceae bacterium]|nr:phosphopantetheine-binding protein [Pseudonocardiaceae bacterium]
MADLTAQATIEAAVLAVLRDVLDEPESELLAQPVLAAHEWDSLTSLETLSQLERRLGINLDLRRYHAVRDLDDLVELVATAVASRTATGRR